MVYTFVGDVFYGLFLPGYYSCSGVQVLTSDFIVVSPVRSHRSVRFQRGRIRGGGVQLFVFSSLARLFAVFHLSSRVRIFFRPSRAVRGVRGFLIVVDGNCFRVFRLLLSFF